jgi:hypothetical protein
MGDGINRSCTMRIKFYLERLKLTHFWKNLEIDEKIVLKWILAK